MKDKIIDLQVINSKYASYNIDISKEKYDGFTNHLTWNITLWLSDGKYLDPLLFRYKNSKIDGKEIVKDFIYSFMFSFTNKFNSVTKDALDKESYDDILASALNTINFDEVAEHLFEGIERKE